ncbi:---NA--- [Paramuricea clavata]|uniref:---NA n=1 Tax=Paramuricea clavata TaxID=317549 RepID=A0A6S7IF77_PARCT|nr:---NA--- [Paramuricea clavata]
MAGIYRLLCQPCLIICVLLLELSSVHCCMRYPENAVFPRKFVFEAFPSVNVSLGDKVELRCTANGTLNLTSVQLLSRMHRNFNPTCSVASGEGICSYLIDSLQLWDIGKYDCIKLHKDGSCYSKSLVLQKAIEEPTETTTVTTTITTKVTAMTTMKPQEILISEPAKHVTKHSDNPTPSDEATSLTSQTLKHVTLVLLTAVIRF